MIEFIKEHWLVLSVIMYLIVALPVCVFFGTVARWGRGADMKTGDDPRD